MHYEEPSQWSKRNQICTSAVLSKVLNHEYLGITQFSTALRENDSKGCFEQILPSKAVSICRRYYAGS